MHGKIINNIYDIITKGTENGIGQLYTEDQFYDSTTITFGNKKHVNFGSYSYLSLEHDMRLKDAAIDAIQRFGIQYPSSRTYVSTTLYNELECLMEQIFENPIVLATTTTLAHMAAMPILVEEGDVIIMDQQVHSSVQFMINHIKQHGVPFFVVRHNNMEQLEKKIQELSKSYKRVWYMCDGVYSMYGDTAPIQDLNALLDKYSKFNLYVDDAHGMSWAGENGAGYVFSKCKLHDRMVVVTSLNKAFAAGGSVIVLSDSKMANKIKTCGGPLIFAGQHQMSSLGAALACAKIHLSEEITEMQNELLEKIHYCHELLLAEGLPVISEGETPIFFVGVGLPKVGYNLVKKLMDRGHYLNLAVFPAVAETCTGVRFTLTKSHSFEQIEKMVEDLSVSFKLALIEEDRSMGDIYKAFRKVKTFKIESKAEVVLNDTEQFRIQHETSIANISEQLWNSKIGKRSLFDWNAMSDLEAVFKNNVAHNNWDFHYFMLFDKQDNLVFATYMTVCLTKDDALAASSISLEIEQRRIKDKYYLCSKTLMMGCPISTGKHYYMSSTVECKSLLNFFFKYLDVLQEKLDTTVLNLRDFASDNEVISNYFLDQGFIKVEMPTNYVLTNEEFVPTVDDYLSELKSSQRRFVKLRALKKECNFDLVEISQFNRHTLNQLNVLYKNVQKRSFELNLFEFPSKIIEQAVSSPNWDVIGLRIKGKSKDLIAMAVSYVNDNNYHFLIAGLDYDYVKDYDVYTQLLWQIVKRAKVKRCIRINFGMTTGQNKRKFGATEIKTSSYVQLKDNFNATVIMQMTSENGFTTELKKRRAYVSSVKEY
ncbi:MAG: aminotransferase class I/II-fold pyridoxal phosphate-dependent enzyme [Crocinitomix sp.]|nr:aminotransferase class I/II-fold pyridoxal phosphate-dependent enzyme [Crocinitomix sp.]